MKNEIEMTSSKKRFFSAFPGLAPFFCFFVVFLILLLPIQLRGASDDTAHIDSIMNMGIPAWIKMRAATWQPRFASDFAFAVLLFRLPLWKFLNAAVMSVLLWIITRTASYGACHRDGSSGTVTNKTERLSTVPEEPSLWHARFATLAVFVCLFFFLIHPNVITSGSVWYTGSFYYLWPAAAMLLGLSPFFLALYGKRLPCPRVLTPLCFLFSLCACFIEQTMAVQIGVSLLILLRLATKKKPLEDRQLPGRQQRHIPRALLAQFILMLVVGAVFFYLDSVSPRVTQQAELPLFPEFANFSAIDKLLLGMNVYTTHLLHVSNILFTILAAFAGWLAFQRIKHARFLVFLPAVWALVNALPLPWGYTKMTSEALGGRSGALDVGVSGWMGFLYGTRPMASSPEPAAIVLSILAVLCVLSLFFLLIKAFPGARDRFLAVVLYLASFLSGILIGFSPSVWASESRPNFLSNFLLLLLLAMLLRGSLCKPDSKGIGDAESDTETATDAGLRTDPTTNPKGFSLRRSLPTKIFLTLLAVFAVYVWILYHTTFATNTYWWY